jgi:hypothetical protein
MCGEGHDGHDKKEKKNSPQNRLASAPDGTTAHTQRNLGSATAGDGTSQHCHREGGVGVDEHDYSVRTRVVRTE